VNAGGRVQVSNFDGALDATAALGGLHLAGHFTQLSARTNNQLIVLTLPADTNALVEADARSVSNETGATEETQPTQRPRRFKLGNGGPVFSLRSGEGRIVIRRRERSL
jgi:hypothetical protein